jgi:large subunit ribosomal protein L15
MSILNQLPTIKGSRFEPKRKGRGDATGQGGTAGKGHKGQLARAGGRVRRGFEGGQMPLYRRMPKVGFNNINRIAYSVVNLKDLNKFSGAVGPDLLRQAGLVKGSLPVKILAQGQLQKAVQIQAHAFSEKAKAAIEAAGGKVEVIK